MNILVINSGSSSLKCQYFINGEPIASLLVENIGDEKSGRYILNFQNKKSHPNKKIANHHEVLKSLFEIFTDTNIINSIEDIDAVGHRVVHGGELFSQPTLITTKVLNDIKSVSHLAPLHNPANIDGIEIIQANYPTLAQVAIFDTAFHQTMPKEAYLYPLPYALYEENHIRRYGFHGTSHYYVAKRAAVLLKRELNSLNLITLHLGNGASATAIKNGMSIDTTMGLTPLEGLMMGSRCGDIDPAIIIQMQRDFSQSIEEVDKILNKKSGLTGICGTNDMRTIVEQADDGESKSQLALDMFTYRIKKYIGAYTIALGRVDAIIFTGGIGENSAKIREMVCDNLEESIGAKIDLNKNQYITQNDRVIHDKDSTIDIFVIKTDEELEIALQTEKLITFQKHN